MVVFNNCCNGAFCRGVASARARDVTSREGGRPLALEDAFIITNGSVRRSGGTGGFVGGMLNIASSDEREGVGAAFQGEIKDVSVDGWKPSHTRIVIIKDQNFGLKAAKMCLNKYYLPNRFL